MASKALSFLSRTRPTATFTSPQTAFKPISSARNFSFTAAKMGITKTLISPGNGVDKPKDGDVITMEYTGNLHDPNAPGGKGKQFDSSVGRGDFTIPIGVGKLIRGWDEGIVQTDGGMTLGEKSTLLITGDYAYGNQGFPGLIPPNATLVFDVQLKAINDKKM